MAKNKRLPEGRTRSLTVPVGVKSGSPVAVGAYRGVAIIDRDSVSGKATVDLYGSYELTVIDAVASQGTNIYITPFKAAPVLSLGATATTGGTFAAGTYFWKITAIDADGETTGSNEVTATIAANGTQVLNWAAITGATGYKVYRGTAAGAENVLVTSVGAVTTYTDTGTAGSAATVPTANTTGGGKLTASATGNALFGVSDGTKAAAPGPLEVQLLNGPAQV